MFGLPAWVLAVVATPRSTSQHLNRSRGVIPCFAAFRSAVAANRRWQCGSGPSRLHSQSAGQSRRVLLSEDARGSEATETSTDEPAPRKYPSERRRRLFLHYNGGSRPHPPAPSAPHPRGSRAIGSRNRTSQSRTIRKWTCPGQGRRPSPFIGTPRPGAAVVPPAALPSAQWAISPLTGYAGHRPRTLRGGGARITFFAHRSPSRHGGYENLSASRRSKRPVRGGTPLWPNSPKSNFPLWLSDRRAGGRRGRSTTRPFLRQ